MVWAGSNVGVVYNSVANPSIRHVDIHRKQKLTIERGVIHARWRMLDRRSSLCPYTSDESRFLKPLRILQTKNI